MNLTHSLYTRLAAVILVGFLVIGTGLLVFVQQLTRDHEAEVQQALHADLAAHIAHDNAILRDGNVDPEAVKAAFKNMMILGPSFEFYLLDRDGRILNHAAPDGVVKRERVDLAPIDAFLDADPTLPIRGDDPRSLTAQKVFSVTRLEDRGTSAYLYIIIGGQAYDSVAALLEGSHYVRVATDLFLAGLALTLVVLLWSIALVMRPLRRLTDDVDRISRDGFNEAALIPADPGDTGEIGRLREAFAAMKATLDSQYLQVRSNDELRRELMAYISHDLRTPLASLKGYLETWQMKQPGLSAEESTEYIQIARKNAEQMTYLVDGLFELAHLDSGNVTMHTEPVAIAELAVDVMQKFRLQAEARKIVLEVSPQDPSLVVDADIEKLDRVFTNLIDNALRHCDAGDRVDIALSAAPDTVTVEIKDTGCGIPADELPNIFDPHFKASNSVREERLNSGLGLAITRRLLKLHQSDISVISELASGTTFRFRLRAAWT